MTDFASARSIESRVGAIMSAPASALTPVPEIQSDSPQDAVHKLQVQVLALTDALAAVIAEVERIRSQLD